MVTTPELNPHNIAVAVNDGGSFIFIDYNDNPVERPSDWPAIVTISDMARAGIIVRL